MENEMLIDELSSTIRQEVDRYCDIPVFDNGLAKDASYGRHYSDDGYYYGQKWQCVEYVKRFYYHVLDHRMPNVWGHARDFFNVNIGDGEINIQRNLLQFENGGNIKPQVHDILVFSDTRFGHLAINHHRSEPWSSRGYSAKHIRIHASRFQLDLCRVFLFYAYS